jgi:hypothetical protein
MSAGSAAGPVALGTSTLEVRWILPGARPHGMAHWFGRLPKRVESRQDTYLLNPRLEGLSVKIRGDTRLEVKLQDGTSEVFDLPGRARGRMSSWQKWSFPIGSGHQQIRDSPDWRRVEKARGISWFSSTGELLPAPAPGEESPVGCTVELTDIVISGEAWWTLGFEATGPPRGRRGAIESTAAVVFGAGLPDGVTFRLGDSLPYSTWLHHQ